MDIVSHGLWGGLAFGRSSKRDYWLAFIFGLAPDIFSFGLLTIAQILGIGPRIEWSDTATAAASIPQYVQVMYNYTHSLVIAALVFGIVWILLKKPWLPLLAWPLHILFDIPTHSTDFYPTPFLWPVSTFGIDGIPWSQPWIFFPNWLAIIISYAVWYFYYKRSRIKT